MIDLMAYAEANRLRTRNLADGRALEPMNGKSKRMSAGYGGPTDRDDAIIGSGGYVTAVGVPEGKVGVFVRAGSSSGLTARLRPLDAIPWAREQRGDLEAFGYVSEADLPMALKAIKVYRIGSGNPCPNTSGLRR